MPFLNSHLSVSASLPLYFCLSLHTGQNIDAPGTLGLWIYSLTSPTVTEFLESKSHIPAKEDLVGSALVRDLDKLGGILPNPCGGGVVLRRRECGQTF